MKHLLFTVLLFLSLATVACCFIGSDRENRKKAEQTAKTATIVRETQFQGERIDAIEIGFAFQAVVRKSDRPGVTLSLDSRLKPYLICRLENGRLTLGMKSNRPQYLNLGQYWVTQPTAVIQVGNLKEMKISGAATVAAEGDFKADDFEVRTSGAAKLDGLHVEATGSVVIDCSGASHLKEADFGRPNRMMLKASGASQIGFSGQTNRLEIDASGASRVAFSGRAKRFDLTASGSTEISSSGHAERTTVRASGATHCQLSKLQTDQAECSASGASDIDCHVTGELSATAQGASRITCQGNPTVVKKEAARASSIDIR